jgi:hypothetical protein
MFCMSFYNYRSHCGSLGGEIIRQAFAAVKDGSANDSQTAQVQQIMDGSANKKQCSVVTNIHNGLKKGYQQKGWLGLESERARAVPGRARRLYSSM